MNHHSVQGYHHIAHKWVYLGFELQNWSLVIPICLETEHDFSIQEKLQLYRFHLLTKRIYVLTRLIPTLKLSVWENHWSDREDETNIARGRTNEKPQSKVLLWLRNVTHLPWLGKEKNVNMNGGFFFWFIIWNLNTFKNHSPWSILGYYRLNERRI